MYVNNDDYLICKAIGCMLKIITIVDIELD